MVHTGMLPHALNRLSTLGVSLVLGYGLEGVWRKTAATFKVLHPKEIAITRTDRSSSFGDASRFVQSGSSVYLHNLGSGSTKS
eukprot:5797634-Amphidinium_carterae.1